MVVLFLFPTAATPGAQSIGTGDVTASPTRVIDQLSRRGVFEGSVEVDFEHAASPPSAADHRIRWLIFYQLYTDDVLSRYSPGGAAGARFDLFQFADFPDAQPFGYPIHIVVADGRTTLIGVVDSLGDKEIAGVRAREVPGVASVENALVVAP